MWPHLKKGSPNWKLAPNAALKQLFKDPLTNKPDFNDALAIEATRRARLAVAGMRLYQHHPARRNVPEAPVLWQHGQTRLLDYGPQHKGAPILLIIPSLINRFDILDIDRKNSFLRYLAEGGLRPMVVDWGVEKNDELKYTLEDYIRLKLLPAFDWIFGQFNEAKTSNKIHVFGYCMGGLMALALATLRREQIKTLSLFATPWDFHKPDPKIGSMFSELMKEISPTLDTLGYLPVDVLQTLFAFLQPLQAMTKFADFARLDPNSPESRNFVLLEDWLNDGVPLVAPTARECLIDWYSLNLPAKGLWQPLGQTVDPRKIEIPSYVVVPGQDRIVPPESGLPLAKLIPHAVLHEPMVGHIGMMASIRAPHIVWAPYQRWLQQHS